MTCKKKPKEQSSIKLMLVMKNLKKVIFYDANLTYDI